MTDRELLELAAKAAGIRLEWDGPPDQWKPIYYQGKTYHSFEPLTDDGDALRLAVNLNIVIWECAQYGRAMAEVRYGTARGEYWELIENDDTYAATRRAIVRAAAEIGRSM